MRQPDNVAASEAVSAAPTGAQPRDSVASRIKAWAYDERVDLAIVTSITLLAAVLRLWRLGTVPLGLHGDEAWTGIDARRILAEGWIGPYVISALGQPTGPLYFTALLFKFMPQDTFTVRFSMALFGIATIPLAYVLFAAMFNRTVAAFASLILAAMAWHLHLSRTGFMVTTQPFMELLVLWALWKALEKRAWRWYIATGLLLGLGIYSYNAYTLFLPIPFVALAWAYFRTEDRRERRRHLVMSALLALTALAVSVPMIEYVATHYSTYHEHQTVVGLTNSTDWHAASNPFGKAELIWDRAVEWQDGLIFGDRPDLGDGLATDGHPVIDPVIYALAIAGLAMAAWRFRRPEYIVLIAAVVILPWGALLTVGDGLFRRTLGLAPFVAALAALPLAWLWQRAFALRDPWRPLVAAAVLLAPIYAGTTAAVQYFGPVQDDIYFRYVYPYQLDAAAHYMATLPRGTVVYYYSDRWPLDYETVRFEAPNVSGVSRYDPDGVTVGVDLAANRRLNAAFVLLGPYIGELDAITNKYPGGVVEEQKRDGEVLFVAYYLPATGR